MLKDEDQDTREKALELTKGLAKFLDGLLGEDLLGFYLLGSLAHGGFNRRYSDIDIGLILKTSQSTFHLEELRKQAAYQAPDLANKVSIFWTDRTFSVGRFAPLDRLDYLDNSVALLEREVIRPDRPSLDDIRNYLKGSPYENWVNNTKRFVSIKSLGQEDHKPFLRSFLYAARFFFSWRTGIMASNDAAMALLREEKPIGFDLPLLETAFQIRLSAADPDPLFKQRKSLTTLVDACSRLLE